MDLVVRDLACHVISLNAGRLWVTPSAIPGLHYNLSLLTVLLSKTRNELPWLGNQHQLYFKINKCHEKWENQLQDKLFSKIWLRQTQLLPYVPPGLGSVWPCFASFPQCWACHCILLCHFLVKTRDIACIQWSSQIVKVISKLVHVFGMIFWDGIHAKLSQGNSVK